MASFAKSINVPFNKKMLSKVFFITKRKHPSKKVHQLQPTSDVFTLRSCRCNLNSLSNHVQTRVVVGDHESRTAQPPIAPTVERVCWLLRLERRRLHGFTERPDIWKHADRGTFFDIAGFPSLLLDGPAVEVAHSTECALM